MTKYVVMIIYPNVQLLDASGPMEVMAAARDTLGQPVYSLAMAGPEAGAVTGSSGLQVFASLGWADLDANIDTLLVAGGNGARAIAKDPLLIATLQRLAPKVRRIGSVCSGAFPLAEAGLLDGKTATTHWARAGQLRAQYPKVRVQEDAIYCRDGNTITSAGVTAGLDLALSLIEEDAGFDMAMQVARYFVMYLRRPGGQSQFSAQLRGQMAGEGPMARLVGWLLDNLDKPLTVPDLARQVHMSPRHFQRRFSDEIGVPPATFVEAARLDKARGLLESSDLSIELIARKTGFSSAERLRRALTRRLGSTPRAYRARFSYPLPPSSEVIQ